MTITNFSFRILYDLYQFQGISRYTKLLHLCNLVYCDPSLNRLYRIYLLYTTPASSWYVSNPLGFTQKLKMKTL